MTSWSPGKQQILELLVQARRGLTGALHGRATDEGQASFTTFVIGLYGSSEPVDQYESVFTVASGFSIAGVVPYLKQALHGYNTCTSHVRRIYFVWELNDKDMYISVL